MYFGLDLCRPTALRNSNGAIVFEISWQIFFATKKTRLAFHITQPS
jgi:hypothetical protein